MRFAVVMTLAALAASVGCATSSDEDVSRGEKATSVAALEIEKPELPYPAGPYGLGEGAVIANLAFAGKVANKKKPLYEQNFRTIQLSDYHDREKVKVLLLTSCAAWCRPCQLEEPLLQDLYRYYQAVAPGQVEVLTVIGEGPAFEPADETDFDNWAKTYGAVFPLALDSGFALLGKYNGTYGWVANPVGPGPTPGSVLWDWTLGTSGGTYPFHMIIRTHDMRIAKKVMGVTPEVGAAINGILANPDAPLAEPPPADPGPKPEPYVVEPPPPPPPPPPGVCMTPEDCGPFPPPPAPCPDGHIPGISCASVNNTCTWVTLSCDPPPPPPTDCSAPGACGPLPPSSPPCPDGSPATLACKSVNNTCMWTALTCGDGQPPPPPPPPPPVDCSAPDACGPSLDDITCPDGTVIPGASSCSDLGGYCGWVSNVCK